VVVDVPPKRACRLRARSADEAEPVSLLSTTVSVDWDTQVADAIAELSLGAFPKGLRAALLTGSLARGEGTWLREGSGVRLAGDIDLLAVFENRTSLPPHDRVARLERAIEDRLSSAGIKVHLSLSPVPAGYLRRLQPNIFSYELIAHGKVVCGDAHILELAPVFTASAIPLDDGFRLLMNRMIELLETLCTRDVSAATASAFRYRAMKLWLDMGTSYLLFERQYSPTYRGRAVRLCELAAEPRALAPIALRRFAQTVAIATRCKFGESGALEMREFADLATLIDDAHSLWRWELERLTAPGASDTDLLRRWIAAEPIAARMRGWAAVVKRSGRARAMARMPGWIGLARRGSPRRLIYAAASELLFALARLFEEGSVRRLDSRWNELRRGLPITDSPENRASSCAWRRLGQTIAFNYTFFLAPTRS
jgi:hypothetical protein